MGNKLKTSLDTLLMATSLLTRIPVSAYLPKEWQEKTIGYSALWYPFVGTMLALCLWLFTVMLPSAFSPWVLSIVIVSLWVMITGALHLDGLADCIDALYAGHKEFDSEARKTKILSVLKDSASGSMAVVGLVLLLLLKVILLAELIVQPVFSLGVNLLAILMLSRLLALVFVVNTPYARDKGIGKSLAIYTPKLPAHVIALLAVIVMTLFFPVTLVISLVVVLLVILYLWRRLWLRSVNGFVGDAIGALIEISEVVILFVIYYYVSLAHVVEKNVL